MYEGFYTYAYQSSNSMLTPHISTKSIQGCLSVKQSKNRLRNLKIASQHNVYVLHKISILKVHITIIRQYTKQYKQLCKVKYKRFF